MNEVYFPIVSAHPMVGDRAPFFPSSPWDPRFMLGGPITLLGVVLKSTQEVPVSVHYAAFSHPMEPADNRIAVQAQVAENILSMIPFAADTNKGVLMIHGSNYWMRWIRTLLPMIHGNHASYPEPLSNAFMWAEWVDQAMEFTDMLCHPSKVTEAGDRKEISPGLLTSLYQTALLRNKAAALDPVIAASVTDYMAGAAWCLKSFRQLFWRTN